MLDLMRPVDPYCLLFLTDTTGSPGEVAYKTEVVPSTSTPRWNEEFTFAIDPHTIHLALTVFDHDAVSENDLIGSVMVAIADLEPWAEADEWYKIINTQLPASKMRGAELRCPSPSPRPASAFVCGGARALRITALTFLRVRYRLQLTRQPVDADAIRPPAPKPALPARAGAAPQPAGPAGGQPRWGGARGGDSGAGVMEDQLMSVGSMDHHIAASAVQPMEPDFPGAMPVAVSTPRAQLARPTTADAPPRPVTESPRDMFSPDAHPLSPGT